MKCCVCVSGWHYNREIYEDLSSLPYLDVFVFSHQPITQVPDWLYELIPQERIFIEPNIGYDWGAYQQFIEKGIYREYTHVFFLHDDVILIDLTLFEVCCSLIDEQGGGCVIGNGRVSSHRDWPRKFIYCYAHSNWKPPAWDFCHDTVRGSFLATSSEALKKIGSFEVLWDRHGYFGVGAGNWSLRATSGKIQFALGENAFVFLSETYRNSSFLQEMERGQENMEKIRSSYMWRVRYKLFVFLSRTLMTWYMNAQSPHTKKLVKHIGRAIFSRL